MQLLARWNIHITYIKALILVKNSVNTSKTELKSKNTEPYVMKYYERIATIFVLYVYARHSFQKIVFGHFP